MIVILITGQTGPDTREGGMEGARQAFCKNLLFKDRCRRRSKNWKNIEK